MFGLDGLFSAWGQGINAAATSVNASFDRASNEKIANENLAYQFANLDYQKALQQKIFNREDTAIQRRKQDLLNSGMNPYAASMGNGAGAGAVVSTQPPHNDFKSTLAQDMAPALSGLGKAFGSLGGIAGEMMDTYNATQQMKQNALYTKYMEIQNKMQNIDYQDMKNQFALDWNFTSDIDNAHYPWTFENANAMKTDEKGAYDYFQQTNRYKLNELRLNNYSFQNELLSKDMDFYIADKIEKYLMDVIKAGSGFRGANRWHPNFQRRR